MADCIDQEIEEFNKQVQGHKYIEEQKKGCFYCAYFKGCHTAVWRKGQTCDLFILI